MNHDRLLTVTSTLAIVLLSLHLADDVRRGFEPGGLSNLGGVAILTLWLSAAWLITWPRVRHVILILGSLFAALMPVIHMSGKGVGGAIAASSGGYFFIWTLYALGVLGTFSLLLAVRGLWRGRRENTVVQQGA